MIIKECENYKYLGLWYNKQGNWTTHLKKLKGRCEEAIQTILFLTQDYKIKGIEMKTIWTMIDTFLLPIILYGTETMTMTKTEMDDFNALLANTIKRILGVPTSTPNDSILIETGYKPLINIIEERRLLYEQKIINYPEENLTKQIYNEENNYWKKENEALKKKLEIDSNLMLHNKARLKKRIRFMQDILWKSNINETITMKSKINYLVRNTKRNITKRPKYMEELTCREAKNILIYRTRMMKVKENYKNNYSNMTCRWCKLENESQNHILEECEEFPIKGHGIKTSDIFNEDHHKLKIITKTLGEIYKELDKKS